MGTHTRGPIAIFDRYKSTKEINPEGLRSFTYCRTEMQESVEGTIDVALLSEVFDWVITDYRELTASGEPIFVPALVRESAHLARIVFSAPWEHTEVAFGD